MVRATVVCEDCVRRAHLGGHRGRLQGDIWVERSNLELEGGVMPKKVGGDGLKVFPYLTILIFLALLIKPSFRSSDKSLSKLLP